MCPVIEINNLIHTDPPNHGIIASLIKKTCVASLWSAPGFILNWIIAATTHSKLYRSSSVRSGGIVYALSEYALLQRFRSSELPIPLTVQLPLLIEPWSLENLIKTLEKGGGERKEENLNQMDYPQWWIFVPEWGVIPDPLAKSI